MSYLISVILTLIAVVLLRATEHFVPRFFFWLMFITARYTPIGRLMTWRECDGLYYTNNTAESAAHSDVDAHIVNEHYRELGGLEVPHDSGSLLAVREHLTIVSAGRRYVGWSHRAQHRMRICGFLHEGRLLYGVWYDWSDDSTHRGSLFMKIDQRHRKAIGIWAGGFNDNAREHLVRVYPWIWTDMHKQRRGKRYSKLGR